MGCFPRYLLFITSLHLTSSFFYLGLRTIEAFIQRNKHLITHTLTRAHILLVSSHIVPHLHHLTMSSPKTQHSSSSPAPSHPPPSTKRSHPSLRSACSLCTPQLSS